MKKSNWLISILFLICSLTSTSAQNKKVVILDSIQAKKIINQLIQGDVAKAELKIFKQMDSVSKSRISTLRQASKLLEIAYSEKESEANSLKTVIEMNEKIIRREKNKKNFYKYLSYLGIGATGYLILTK